MRNALTCNEVDVILIRIGNVGSCSAKELCDLCMSLVKCRKQRCCTIGERLVNVWTVIEVCGFLSPFFNQHVASAVFLVEELRDLRQHGLVNLLNLLGVRSVVDVATGA